MEGFRTFEEFLENQSLDELVELSTQTEATTFEDNCFVKKLIKIYNLPEQFHVALVSLRLSLLSEITKRLR
jgi:hypothetical protein